MTFEIILMICFRIKFMSDTCIVSLFVKLAGGGGGVVSEIKNGK
jgi:hypothetical protein